jgi:hypothetical protein
MAKLIATAVETSNPTRYIWFVFLIPVSTINSSVPWDNWLTAEDPFDSHIYVHKDNAEYSNALMEESVRIHSHTNCWLSHLRLDVIETSLLKVCREAHSRCQLGSLRGLLPWKWRRYVPETSVLTRASWRHISEENILHYYCREDIPKRQWSSSPQQWFWFVSQTDFLSMQDILLSWVGLTTWSVYNFGCPSKCILVTAFPGVSFLNILTMNCLPHKVLPN